MKENKFLKLVKTLDKQELKDFHKYLNGLYGKQEKMIQLFDYFFKYLKKTTSVPLSAEDFILNKLFSKRQSVKVVGNLYVDLYRYLEEFLRWQKINANADNYVKDRMQIDIYKERGLDDWFYNNIEKAKKKINQAPLDVWHYFKLFDLNYTNYFKISTEKHNPNTMTMIEEGLNALDNFFISAKLNYECELKNKKQLQGLLPSTNWLLDSIIKDYPNKFDNNKYALFYFNALDLLNKGEDVAYFKLKTNFEKERSSLRLTDQLIILSLLLNFIAKKIRTDDLKYSQEALDLYQIGLEEKIIINNDELDAIAFFNILNLACRLGKIEWAETFCLTYVSYLNQKEKVEATKIAHSILFFEKRNFNQVLIELRDISFKNVFYGTRARALILKSAVELNMGKYFIKAKCDSFSQSLRRSEVLGVSSLAAYKNFVHLVRMMFVNTQTDKSQLKAYMKEQKFLVYKSWINKMVENFKEPS